MGRWTRPWLAKLLIIAIVASALPIGVHAEGSNGVTVPAPLYSWGFNNGEVQGSTVANNANMNDSESVAALRGNAAVMNDEQRGEVLSLPGGAAGGGWLSLPNDLYSQVTDQLTVAMWLKVPTGATPYTRLLSSTLAEKGLTYNGSSNSWNDPEFSIVTGGETYNHRIFIGTSPTSAAAYKGDVAWPAQLAKDRWQHLIVSMNKTDGSYRVYLDGSPTGSSGLVSGNSTAGATVNSVVQAFFDRPYLDALTHNDFGRSLYQSDPDMTGKFDDIQLYNAALSAEQAGLLYHSYDNSDLDKYVAYHYSFEQAEGSVVRNEVTGSPDAQLGSTAAVVDDSDRGGKVLNLPGGAANGGSWLTLPGNLFAGVNGTNGFAISLWLKVPMNQNASYTRLFSASPHPLGASFSGASWWTDPELALVRGGGDYNMRLFAGIAANGAATDGVDIVYQDSFKADQWQHLVMTMKNDAYAVYLDGRRIADVNSAVIKRFGSTNISSVLPKFFDSAYLQQLVHAAIGRSLYASDGNFTGKIDDFKFYTRYLTEEDVAKMTGIGDPAELIALLNQAESIEQGDYSDASFQYLQSVIAEAEALLADNKASQGQIDQMLKKLQSAIDNLKSPLPEGIAPDYYYTFDQAPNADRGVLNEKPGGTYDAKLESGAGVISDAERGSVLNLPGGPNGGGGWLGLPADLFENVAATGGFTVAMWAKLPNDVHGWSRLFDAGSANYGSNQAPFIYVASQNGSEVNTGDGKQYMNGYGIPKNDWVHVAYSIQDGRQTIYVNGSPVQSMDADNRIFALASAFTKNAIGRSRFTADPDLKAKIDDVMIFKTALRSDQVLKLVGDGYNATLAGIRIQDRFIPATPNETALYDPVSDVSQIPAPELIVPQPAIPQATAVVRKAGTFNYRIEVTSSNGKAKAAYDLFFTDPAKGAIANFYMDRSNGPIMHGASGFLYGISEPNVPTLDLLTPLKPKVVVQKAPGGLQHPTGDGVRVSDTVLEAGAEQIQIYIQDMYYQWPYEFKGLDQYEQLAVETVRKIKQQRNKDKYVFVLFNEPDQIWFGGNMDADGFFAAWKRLYDAVKAEDPEARVAGPNLAGYNKNVMNGFMQYCKTNGCIPDVMTWHELGNGANNGFEADWESHYEHYRGLEAAYGIPAKQIVINEYSWFEDPGAAGSMIQWLSRLEAKKVYGSIAYWHLANSLNELAADANKPNGAWWLYKWYADMSGDTVDIETTNAKFDGLYGLASVDNAESRAYALFGGQDGVATASLHHLANTAAFQGADKVHVKLYRTKFTGYYGTLESPRIEFDGNVDLVQGNLSITVQDAHALDGFYAIVTPATDEPSRSIGSYERVWTRTYEAEQAQLAEGVAIGYWDASPVSDGKYVRGLSSEFRTVTYTVDVPQSGAYKLEVFYGNEAPPTNGKNRAQGQLAKQKLTIDGNEYGELVYDSTVFADYFKSKALYLDLTAGVHTLQFGKSGGADATLDKADLTWIGQTGSRSEPAYVLEAEEAQYGEGFSFARSRAGFRSGGYAEGSGEMVFTAVVKENGYYDLELGYAADEGSMVHLSQRIVKHPSDASAEAVLSTEWSPMDRIKLDASKGKMTSARGPKLYLTAGVNLIKLEVASPAAIDYMKLTWDAKTTEEQTIVVEAEQASLFGTAAILDNANVSGGKLVTGIGESKANGITITVTVPEKGSYKLSIDYSNNEPAPPIVTAEHPTGYIHPYNTDLVERYAQIAVNDGTSQTIYFINTLSWDSTRNTVVDVTLRKGVNKITLYNDNSYRFSNVVQYAPNFDKFGVTKAYLDEKSWSKPGKPN
ncbi:LamG-like jellyroll fold domain-containing protein [Cohnella suwonensis]|uniref:LamG-like jellyroll fold domain-containing protein n=1 Tax=Cohnella suwonensis TaxID=696072 RepID=A0ABW0M116_9BACL